MTTVMLLSAPVDAKDYVSSFASYRAYRSFQILFGFDAQLRLFGEAARRAGCRPLFVPGPENFFLPQSYRRLLEVVGSAAASPADLVHVRFGPLMTQRVAKGTSNVAVVAEDLCAVPANLGRHPFACSDVLPASTTRTLVYDAGHGPYRTLTGRALPTSKLEDIFIGGDLGIDEPDSAVDDEAEIGSDVAVPSSLHVQSLAEFVPTDWMPVAEGKSHAPSIDLRRVLIDRQLRARGPRASGDLVIVPWNLAHQGGAVVDLLAKLARFYPAENVACRPVLFPYNLTISGEQQLAEGVGRLRTEFDRSKLTATGVLVARLTNPRDIGRLPNLFRLAWVDGNDPERAWLIRRLAAIGIRSALIRSPNDRQAEGSQGAAFEIPCDDEIVATARDGFGQRLFRISTVSVRNLSQLVKQSVQEIARHHEASAPAIRTGAADAAHPSFFAELRASAATLAHAAE